LDAGSIPAISTLKVKQNYTYHLLILISLCSIIYFIFLSLTSVRELHQLNNKITRLEDRLNQIKSENRLLKARLERLDDPRFIRSLLARHNYTKKNEILVDLKLPSARKQKDNGNVFYKNKYYIMLLIILSLITTVIIFTVHRRRQKKALQKDNIYNEIEK